MFKKLYRSKITKRILGVFFVLGVTSFLFNGTVGVTNEVHAQTDTQTSTQTTTNTENGGIDKMEIVEIADLILKVVYILLWPLLVIAGMAMDNSMVYASFLNMDAPLWKFWNIVKNFANFTLGFMVLFAIVRNIFAFGKPGDKRAPQKIITQTLIAGVLIQASRFLMAAAIDVSTVATYAVGGLPINVIGSTSLGKQKMLETHSSIDLSKFTKDSKNDSYYSVRYSAQSGGTGINISECQKKNGYIIGRKNGDPKFKNDVWGPGKNACVLGNQIYIFNEFPNTKDAKNNDEYQTALNNVLQLDNDYSTFEKCKYVIIINGIATSSDGGDCANALSILKNTLPSLDDITLATITVPTDIADSNFGSKKGSERLAINGIGLDELVKKSQGRVGPLVTIYSSMLDFSQLSNTQTDSSFGEISGEMLIKLLFAIGLFFPLVALAIVLIVRVGFLWMVIVASPFLVLVETFKLGDSMGDFIKNQLNIKKVFKVIFAPVITVFALSISLVFMSVLTQSLGPNGTAVDKQKISNALMIEQKETTDPEMCNYSILKGCAEIELPCMGGALDIFSRFLVNLIAIGLMRAIVFAAIKANSIGKAIGGQIQSFGQNVFQTLPILPIGGGVGVGSMATVIGGAPAELERKMTTTGEAKARAFIYGEETPTALNAEQAEKIAKGITTTMTTTEVTKVITEVTGAKTEEAAKAIVVAGGPALMATAITTNFTKPTEAIKVAGNFKGILGSNWYAKQLLDDKLGTEKDVVEANKKFAELDPAYQTVLTGEKKDLTDAQGNTKTYEIKADPNDNNTLKFMAT